MKLLRNIMLSLLIANTLGSALLVPLIYLDYSVRKEYIAKVLCINKNKPQLHCNGKCVLAEKIKMAQEQEETSKEVTQKLEISFFFNQLSRYEINNNEIDIIVLHLPFIELKHSSKLCTKVDHPPQLHPLYI